MSKDVKNLYVTDGEDGVRLDKFFKRRWPHINHIQLNKLLRSGQVRVDGGRAKGRYPSDDRSDRPRPAAARRPQRGPAKA